MKRMVLGVLSLLLASATSFAQEKVDTTWQTTIKDNWFVKIGVDMTLQKPYGYPAKDMLKDGRSIGVDVAVGKWLTREIGGRLKVNWENGIIDSETKWLAPFNQPGKNHDKGGYVTVAGDILLDLHNIIGDYRPDRVWNAELFFRAGGVYNFGCEKGSPLIGMGWGNRFRLSDRWGLYADVAYNGVSSGFSMDPSTATGTGSGSNMFFTFDVGVTYNLGGDKHRGFGEDVRVNSIKDKSFWKNWFLQFGADMTLYNPCEKSFKDVFPDGTSMGVDVAVGKWFSPEVGLRGRVNVENAIIENKNLKWLPYDTEKHSSCYDGGGCVMGYLDLLLSAKHIFFGHLPDDKWDMYAFGRMGLGKNWSIDSLSPVVGAGVGCTYRLNDKWSIYADTAYQGITSEFFKGVSWSGATGTGFNGIWDFNIGVQLDL